MAAAGDGAQVPGKINTLQIDGCTKSSVVVDSCVASVDIINCKSCEIQVAAAPPPVSFPAPRLPSRRVWSARNTGAFDGVACFSANCEASGWGRGP